MSAIPQIPEDSREIIEPVARPDIFAFYTKALNAFWIPSEIDMTRDAMCYSKTLTEGERHVLNHVLAFFAISDELVNENIVEHFQKEIGIPEVKRFYGLQLAIENIHADVYARMILSLVDDRTQREELLAAAKNIPKINRMVKYITDCIQSEESLQIRILRMACVEGIFFTGAFCIIYWFRSRGLMPGLAHANELIARDEALHTEFALKLFTMFDSRPAQEEIEIIIRDAVHIAADFVNDALPSGLRGMNATLMTEYVQSVADKLVGDIGYKPIFNVTHQFEFMNQINVPTHTLFFETRVSNYKSGGNATDMSFDADV